MDIDCNSWPLIKISGDAESTTNVNNKLDFLQGLVEGGILWERIIMLVDPGNISITTLMKIGKKFLGMKETLDNGVECVIIISNGSLTSAVFSLIDLCKGDNSRPVFKANNIEEALALIKNQSLGIRY